MLKSNFFYWQMSQLYKKKLKIKIIKFNNTKNIKTITLPKSNIPEIIKDFINKNYL